MHNLPREFRWKQFSAGAFSAARTREKTRSDPDHDMHWQGKNKDQKLKIEEATQLPAGYNRCLPDCGGSIPEEERQRKKKHQRRSRPLSVIARYLCIICMYPWNDGVDGQVQRRDRALFYCIPKWMTLAWPVCLRLLGAVEEYVFIHSWSGAMMMGHFASLPIIGGGGATSVVGN